MGWDGQYYLEKPDFKAIAIQRNTFKHVGEDRQPTGGESKVLAAVKVGNVVYMAVDYNPSPDALQNKSPNVAHKGLINFRYTYGMVTLCRWSRPRGAREGEAMFKEVSETMGPCDYKCPKSILNLLTPCEEVVRLAKAAGCDYAVARYSAGEEGYAYNWRMKCQNHATPPARKAGQVYKLAKPARYQDGTVFETVTLTPNPVKRGWVMRHNNTIYPLPNWALDGAELLNT